MDEQNHKCTKTERKKGTTTPKRSSNNIVGAFSILAHWYEPTEPKPIWRKNWTASDASTDWGRDRGDGPGLIMDHPCISNDLQGRPHFESFPAAPAYRLLHPLLIPADGD